MDYKELSKRGFSLDPVSGLYKISELSTKSISAVYTEKASDRSAPDTLPPVIFPSFWAMTADTTTRNSTVYPKKELQGSEEDNTGIYSWVTPYEIPVIQNHDDYSSPVFGRIVCARIAKEGSQYYLNLIPRLTDSSAIKSVLNGEFYTLSIGVSVEDLKCSICNKMQRAEGWCEHYKGEMYPITSRSGKTENVLCTYSMYGIRGREISFVNVPSDQFAHVNKADMGEDAVKKMISNKTVASTKENSNKTFYISPTNKLDSISNKFGVQPNLLEKDRVFKSGNSLFISQNESFEGESLSKSFAREKGIEVMSKSTESTETTELTGLEKEASTAVVESVVLPDLSNLDKIKEAVADLFAKDQSGELIEERVADAVAEAFSKTGISDDHIVRLQLDEKTGVALFSKSNETLKSLFSETDGQTDYTVESLSEKLDSFLKEKTELETKVSTLEETLSQSQDAKNLVEAQSKLSDIVKELEAERTASKSILVSVVATEMIRTGHKLATSKTLEELRGILSERSRDSLLDSYSDLSLEDSVASSATTVVKNPLTEKSSLSTSEQLNVLLKKKKISPSTSSDVVDTLSLAATVTETTEKEEVTLTVDSNGMITAELKSLEDEDPITKRVKATTLDLSGLT